MALSSDWTGLTPASLVAAEAAHSGQALSIENGER